METINFYSIFYKKWKKIIRIQWSDTNYNHFQSLHPKNQENFEDIINTKGVGFGYDLFYLN